MDPKLIYVVSVERVRDLRRDGTASRTWRPLRRSADHPSLGRRGAGPPAA